jgi:hypothetical protein
VSNRQWLLLLLLSYLVLLMYVIMLMLALPHHRLVGVGGVHSASVASQGSEGCIVSMMKIRRLAAPRTDIQ